MAQMTAEQIVGKVRTQLHDTGKETLTAVRMAFHQYDADRLGVLDATDFNAALNSAGVFLSRREISVLFRTFAAPNAELHVATGVPLTLDLFAFFDAVSGELAGERLDRAFAVWKGLTGGGDELSLEGVLAGFDAASHPRVVTKEIYADEAAGRLQLALEEFMEMEGSSAVTTDLWLRYCAELSATTPFTKDALYNKVLDCFDSSGGSGISPERIEQLEIFLTDKIRQYSPLGKDGLRATLRKFFHQQDQAGTGGLSYEEFSEFLVTVGMVLGDVERSALFTHLAEPCGGQRLGFDFLAQKLEILNAGPGPTVFRGEPPDNWTKYQAGVPPSSLVDKIRTQLLKHHPKGLQSLFMAFRHVDKEQRQWVTSADFYSALRICGLRLGSQEVDRLLHFFDAAKTGKVTYSPFLLAIRGEVPDKRKAILDRAWTSIAGKGASSVPVDVLSKGFEPQFHPKVSNNHQTKESKINDMLEFMGEEKLLGTIARESFMEYFLDESASIPEDPYFERYINFAFRLEPVRGA